MTVKQQLESVKDNVYKGCDYIIEMTRLKHIIDTTEKDAELKMHLCNIVDAGIESFTRVGYNKENFDQDFSLVVFSLGSMPDKK